MATAYVTFAQAGQRAANGVLDIIGAPMRSEAVTTSSTSAAGALIARPGEVALIHSASALYATVGANPTAALTSGVYVPANQTVTIALKPGDKVALIDVA